MDLTKFVQEVAPTAKVYLEDAYLKSLDSNLVKFNQDRSKAYLLLDRTIFHPRSGGQPSDLGTVQGTSFRLEIKRAMLQGGVIVHFGNLEGDLKPGPVRCEIDWANRYLLMRRHTAAHLLDYCLANQTGSHVETTDSWLGEDSYVGYGGSTPPNLNLERLQEIGNTLIQQGLKVNVQTFDRVDAERLIADAPNLARLPKSERLRVVTIERQIPIPCGGTHVLNLKEVGALTIQKTDSVESGFRVYFDVK